MIRTETTLNFAWHYTGYLGLL